MMTKTQEAALQAMKQAGVTFADVMEVFGEPCRRNRHASAFRFLYATERLETDVRTVVVPGEPVADEPGAWVLCWHWITDREAGVTREAVSLAA